MGLSFKFIFTNLEKDSIGPNKFLSRPERNTCQNWKFKRDYKIFFLLGNIEKKGDNRGLSTKVVRRGWSLLCFWGYALCFCCFHWALLGLLCWLSVWQRWNIKGTLEKKKQRVIKKEENSLKSWKWDFLNVNEISR